jgi:Bacterial SH3 domain
MPRVLVIVVMLGLSLGVGLVARSGVSAWLDWVNEPLRQPPDLHLVRQPVTGPAQTGQRPAQPTALPPTLAPARPAPTSTSAPPAVASTPQRTATPAAAATVGTPRAAATIPGSTAVPLTGQERRVANTDGQGVALRDTPGGARQPARGYDEGEVVTILEQQGTWTHIRGRDGREGWVLSVTLAP